MTPSMRVWAVDRPGPLADKSFVLDERPVPVPGRGEVLVRVTACGVCRTDLHLVEGDLPPRRRGVVPGHQVVGTVTAAGDADGRFAVGDRIGVAWLRGTCGECRWCRTGRENLCPRSVYTGWDADGGFAEHTLAPAAYAYHLPDAASAAETAPLLCAGIIGYRALLRARVPAAGRLGIYGFGSSAHLTAQIALAQGAELYVMTRGAENRELARSLGATWVGGAEAVPPVRLDSAIVFAPAGTLVPVALEALERGGTLSLAGIYMSDVPTLAYERHLFLERDVRTVTSNTRRDGEELLGLAARLGVRPHVTTYPFEQADRALRDVAAGRTSGSAVLIVS